MTYIFFPWFFLSAIVGVVGNTRKIGFGTAFLVSLLLSPLIGLILTLTSKSLDTERYEQQMMDNGQRQADALKVMQHHTTPTGQKSIVEQLEQLSRLKEAGHLTDEEYALAKNKIITASA